MDLVGCVVYRLTSCGGCDSPIASSDYPCVPQRRGGYQVTSTTRVRKLFRYFSTFCSQELMLRYNRQGRKVQDLRSKCNTRTQRARNTGTNNFPTAPNASNNVTNYCSSPVQSSPVSPHRGPQPLATPDGLQPLPGALAVLQLCGNTNNGKKAWWQSNQRRTEFQVHL